MGPVLTLLCVSLVVPGVSRAAVDLPTHPSTPGNGTWGPCLLLPCDYLVPGHSHPAPAVWNLSAGALLLYQEPLPCRERWWCKSSSTDPGTFTCNNTLSDSKNWDHTRFNVVLPPDTNRSLNGSLVFSLDELRVKPDIALPPQIFEGVNTTIECSYPLSCEGERPHLSWMRAGDPCNTTIQDEGRNDSLSSNLTFVPSVKDQGRKVSCIAWYHLGGMTTNRTIHLDVKYSPQIHPLPPLTLDEGDQLEVNCTVTSNPPAKVWWSAGGDGAPRVANNTRTLQLDNITLRHQGVYTCHADNGLGSASQGMNLSVNYSSRNLTILLGGNDLVGSVLEVEEGSRLSLLCRAESVPESNLTWLVSGTLRNESRGQNELWLEVDGVSYREHGEHQCLASNHLGQTQRGIRVTLQYTPKEVEVRVKEGHSPPLEGNFLSLSCPHKANPPATSTTWHVLDASGKKLLVSTGASFDIRSLRRNQDGAYSCTVTNTRGSSASGTFLLHIHYRPEISRDSGCHQSPGGVTCVCVAHSNPPGHLSWQVTHINLTGNQTHGSHRVWQRVEGQLITGSLELLDLQAHDKVPVWCTVRNPHGMDTLKVYLWAAGHRSILELLIPVLGTAAGTLVLTLFFCQLALCCSRRPKTARRELVEMQGLTVVSGTDMEEHHNSSPYQPPPELSASQTQEEAGDHWSLEGEDEETGSRPDWSEGQAQELHYASIDFSSCRPADGVVGAQESTEYAQIKPQ